MKNRGYMKFLQALSVFTGTVIGVGVFGLPFVAAQVGWWPVVIYFIILAPIIGLTLGLLGEVACATKAAHRVPGYAGYYLGSKAKKICFVVSFSGLVGAQLAYLIIGGEFLRGLLAPIYGGSPLLYLLVFFGVCTILIYYGIHSIAEIEFVLLVAFFIILGLLVYLAYPHIAPVNFINFSPKYLILPYGVVMFSLWGSSVVPEVAEMMRRRQWQVRVIIGLGMVLIVIAYLAFIYAIFGASGQATSMEAMAGLARVIGPRAILWGYVLGIITTFTSYLTLGLTLKKILCYDIKCGENVGFLVASFLPLLLFFLGFDNFINIIGLSGALAIGAEAIIIVLIYRAWRAKKRRPVRIWPWILITILVFGIVAEIASNYL